MDQIPVDLSGVPETLLWNLGRRAVAARSSGSLLTDPRAVEVAQRLQYDFSDAGRGARWHAVRVATFDAAVRRFLSQHPAGTVVALGEGLETQFWRVDNGQVTWLTVDLPAVVDLRGQVLPEGPRQRSFAGSALDLDWFGQVDPAAPILITAQGLLPYFGRDQVHDLIAAIAARAPGSSLVVDVVPAKMLELIRKLPDRETDQAARLWSWTVDRDERAALSRIPGVVSVRDLAPPRAAGFVPLVLLAVRGLPRQVRYALPVFPVLEFRF